MSKHNQTPEQHVDANLSMAIDQSYDYTDPENTAGHVYSVNCYDSMIADGYSASEAMHYAGQVLNEFRQRTQSKVITLNIGLNNNARISRLHSNATAAKTVADIAYRIFESIAIDDYRFGYVVSSYEGADEPTAVVEFDTECNDIETVQQLTRIACSVFSQECIAALIETKTDRSSITRGLLEFNSNIEPCYEFDQDYFKRIWDCIKIQYVERPTL